MKHLPILKIGQYGLHVHKNPVGTYSFVGTIPFVLCIDKNGKTPNFATEKEAIQYVKEKMPEASLSLGHDGLHIIEP